VALVVASWKRARHAHVELAVQRTVASPAPQVEELQRVIDFQQYQLMHQEKRLRAQIYVDFEAQLKEMADKVDVAHTMEQGRDLAIRERLLTDMAALRKDTMLKLQLQTWMVRLLLRATCSLEYASP
jgi:hypothetical protein